MKVRMAIYNLKGKANIWWQDLKLAKGLKRKQMEWCDFKKYFKKQYLSEIYYERKMKEFYELRLGQMTMEDVINKFLELLRFVPYIREDKVKIQQFLSYLPQSYRDKIEFDNPKSLSEVFKKNTNVLRLVQTMSRDSQILEGQETRPNEPTEEGILASSVSECSKKVFEEILSLQ
jgi:hypothetical protein